ncbi:hypothetical protein HO133_003381 [Letharia lupina]|uniref:Glycoprotease family protein n=1 Tax=Letharia lupina TaxID=560253 RepID=A0A8H6FA41_9LECA|nr:uncharacterized protein HO133_003381 [Letharia lupina]KAF6220249.1 hypothetical protein HO133_003381 [Letharia lupina]
MTADSQPNDASPQRIDLAASRIPRMPFSSPMGEEVLSPTSPPQSSQTPPQVRKKGQQAVNGQSNTTLSNQRFPMERPTKGDVGRKQERQDKSRLHGLNVVTSFSNTPGFTQKAADGNGKQDQGLGLRRQGTQESTDKTGNLGLEHQRSGRPLKPSASKGRLDDLKRAASKASTLSPSDRAVMIGISVSPEDLADHDISNNASPAEPEHLGTGRYTISRRPSVTPSIIVTPAQRKPPWSDESDELIQPPRRRARAASSVYSQAQLNGVRFVDSSIVPPIPPLPPDLRRPKAEFNRSSGRQLPPSSSRIVSTSTIFDEELDSDIGGRPSIGESQVGILTKQASMDSIASIATRHRSRGWWDHIVTPFWPRSPMTFKGSSPPIPTLPNARQATEAKHDRDRPTSHNVSPETAEHEGLRSGHTSWTDMSLDAEWEKRAPDLDDQPHKELLVSEPPRQLPATDTPISPVEHEGFGAASEYYEACLYDMHSPEPYFKCQNHTCLPSQADPTEADGGQRNASARAADGDAGPREVLERLNTEPSQSLAVQQAPRNRFSAAFREAVAPESRPKPRPVSEETEIEDLDTTPDVEEAHAAPVVRAPEPVPAAQSLLPDNDRQNTREIEEPTALPPSEPTPHQPPAYSPPRQERPPRRYVAVMPPNHQPNTFEQTGLPAPPTSGAQRQMPRDTLPMAETSRDNAESQLAGTRNMRIRSYENPETSRPETTLADLYPPPRDAGRAQRAWEIREKDTQTPREHNSKVLAGFGKCFGREKKPMSKKKKWTLIALAIGLLLMVILIMVLAMTLTRKGGPGQTVPVQTAWLNITGYPPIPTGISTIVQPKPVSEISECVVPSTMWSCDLPKEEQQSFSTGAADQPNFRVEIVFQNGTNGIANASSVNRRSYGSNHGRSYGHMVNPVSAGSFVRDRLLQARNALSGNSDSPSPPPPSQEDQTFLGNTTDNNTVPFDGEYTPFFMSFLSSSKLPSRLLKRQSSSNTDNAADPFPNITNSIPPPDTNANGTAAAAVLLPYPSAQPLRLYNRGQSTEHYGFYTYFSKSVFLKSTAPIDGISNNTSSVPDDEDGGAEEEAASVRCTWAQTRFLVQIWTNKGFVASSQASDTNSTVSSNNSTNLTASSANDFQAPGSFPYPVTITLDRHGGDIDSKMIYCYGIDDEENPISNQKKIELEDRSFGGTLVNPTTLGPFGNVNVTLADGGPSGIDGGSGGCECQWKNFGWE